jgi:hypothetical protein
MHIKEDVLRAIDSILNDVVDQSLKHLMRHPQSDNELNLIIREATEEISRLKGSLENHHAAAKEEKELHYRAVADELHSNSIRLLQRLNDVKERNAKNSDQYLR